jgi:hypothetical protein
MIIRVTAGQCEFSELVELGDSVSWQAAPSAPVTQALKFFTTVALSPSTSSAAPLLILAPSFLSSASGTLFRLALMLVALDGGRGQVRSGSLLGRNVGP